MGENLNISLKEERTNTRRKKAFKENDKETQWKTPDNKATNATKECTQTIIDKDKNNWTQAVCWGLEDNSKNIETVNHTQDSTEKIF